ncbi:quinone oxidoreductase family protein [Pseudomonas turukhanskensis]|uniref:Oxidoreductase n=1 Tax=Pseudomonas turukhanskensis TaxID=1806536 RepID=A0A9W6NHN4_9PSED|nr:zinc-binding alcohol dehydrogenase family protein [Pseudomonas turukhanskensis]GLK91288.1 oxidoreductase [Pseudomonas turukhanskensis]
MHALQFTVKGDLDSLQYLEVPTPSAGDGEVLVEIRAAGLNPSDVKNVLGRFPYTTVPRIPGRDFAGVVVQGPSHLLGQAVWGTGKGLGFTRDGSHASHIALPAEDVALKPPALSFAQAASCGVPFTTAWDALQRTDVKAGTTFLVIGANGAVGDAAVSLAKARGAQVLAAVRRPESLAELSQRGIPGILLGDPAALPAQVEEHFQGGAEVIFDTTGFWLPAAVPALGTFGRIAIIAAPVDGNVQLPALALYRRGGVLVGVNSLLYTPKECAAMLDGFGSLFDQALLPLPDELHEVPLSEGVARYQAVNGGSSEKFILLP